MGQVTVLGAGVAGLVCATALVEAGHDVRVYDPSGVPGDGVSALAGGMLAPFSELDNLPLDRLDDACAGVAWWRSKAAKLGFDCPAKGTLVVAHRADRDVLGRFEHELQRVPGCFERLGREALTQREPSLGSRFDGGLWVPGEAYLEPRRALAALAESLRLAGASLVPAHAPVAAARLVDCRGTAAPEPDLRPVRGEIAFVRAPGVALTHCVRLMHPRIPLYVVPHGASVFAVGATMLESSDDGGMTVGSALELLSAATLVHPSFAEAEIVALESGLRPAYPDNRPAVRQRSDGVVSVNGLFRHGYLLSPSLAEQVVAAFHEGTK